MRLSNIPYLERTDKLGFTGYYEWYCRKDTMQPGQVAVFYYDAAKGEAIDNNDYFRNLNKDDFLTREECYELVRMLYSKEKKEEQQIDILDAEVVQCSLF